MVESITSSSGSESEGRKEHSTDAAGDAESEPASKRPRSAVDSAGSSQEGSLNNHVDSPSCSRASSIASSTSGRYSYIQAYMSRLPDYRLSTVSTLSANQSSDTQDHWCLPSTNRPTWEPPVLDYRKFEEEGSMYDSVHRHPDTKAEDWYAYTDAEIEVELLGDYHSWICSNQREAVKIGDPKRQAFYADLKMELDTDRLVSVRSLDDVKETVYQRRADAKLYSRPRGSRVQQQFDETRKRWRDADSADSDWDEREWEIFGPSEGIEHDTVLDQYFTDSKTELQNAEEQRLLEESIRAPFIPQLFSVAQIGVAEEAILCYSCLYIGCQEELMTSLEKIIHHVEEHISVFARPARDFHNEYLNIRWECLLCDQYFPQVSLLDDHCQSVHRFVNVKVVAYDCMCGKRFCYLHDLTSHRQLESCAGALSRAEKLVETHKAMQIMHDKLQSIEVQVEAGRTSLDSDNAAFDAPAKETQEDQPPVAAPGASSSFFAHHIEVLNSLREWLHTSKTTKAKPSANASDATAIAHPQHQKATPYEEHLLQHVGF